jgi:hypothetical protein
MTTPDNTNPTPSLDALGKQAALDAAMENAEACCGWRRSTPAAATPWTSTRSRSARSATCPPRLRERVPGWPAQRLPPRQVDACDEARGKEARTQPRNPDLVDRSTTDPTT